ncbi:MAG: hypothetical protein CMP65_01170 [Flavobacteriales bacterium]|nr:hypothetical protein [Flavobacteriales bacterium]|tara:strand:+ start:2181 stop:2471 length:291 start_codon:yes stop_codon:yes gene_type:complete
MIIYALEIKIKNEVREKWTKWMQEIHIPEMMDTKLFTTYRFSQDQQNKNLFYIEYTLKSIDDYNIYKKEFSIILQKKHQNAFQNLYEAKRKLLSII